MSEPVHVAVAVITDKDERILIARRPDNLHQGGLWEFPGGKLEPGESVKSALVREIEEEIGLHVDDALPLIKINYQYPDKKVLLDVWQVTRFHGQASGRENQEWCWVRKSDLRKFEFPAANGPIINAVRLPDRYLITPEPGANRREFMIHLERSLTPEIRLLQFRAKTVSDADYREMALDILDICRTRKVSLILNADPSILNSVDADGIHLTGSRLKQYSRRPVDNRVWLGVSCHNAEELVLAESINADFVVLAPVMPTATHSATPALGWQEFEKLVSETVLPVYALGGMQLDDIMRARIKGAQGIAAIRGLWNYDN